MTLRHDEHIGVVAGAALHLIDPIIGSAVRQRFTILRVAACRRSVGPGEAAVGLAVLAPAFAAWRTFFADTRYADLDRKSVVSGKSGAVRVELGSRRNITKK